jgi:hypothetical protein
VSLPTIFLIRAVILWVIVRVAVLVVGAAVGAPTLDLAPSAALLLVGVSVALGLVDVARRGERALLENFGVSRLRLSAWLALPALAGEAAVAALLHP